MIMKSILIQADNFFLYEIRQLFSAFLFCFIFEILKWPLSTLILIWFFNNNNNIDDEDIWDNNKFSTIQPFISSFWWTKNWSSGLVENWPYMKEIERVENKNCNNKQIHRYIFQSNSNRFQWFNYTFGIFFFFSCFVFLHSTKKAMISMLIRPIEWQNHFCENWIWFNFRILKKITMVNSLIQVFVCVYVCPSNVHSTVIWTVEQRSGITKKNL